MMGIEIKERLKALNVNRSITVVIPTLNEEHGIAKVIEELHSRHNQYTGIDGYSKDRTVNLARV